MNNLSPSSFTPYLYRNYGPLNPGSITPEATEFIREIGECPIGRIYSRIMGLTPKEPESPPNSEEDVELELMALSDIIGGCRDPVSYQPSEEFTNTLKYLSQKFHPPKEITEIQDETLRYLFILFLNFTSEDLHYTTRILGLKLLGLIAGRLNPEQWEDVELLKTLRSQIEKLNLITSLVERSWIDHPALPLKLCKASGASTHGCF